MFAMFPCYRCDEHDGEARAVVMDFVNVTHDNWDGEGWQTFQPLMDCEPLWRDNSNSDNRRTAEECLQEQREGV